VQFRPSGTHPTDSFVISTEAKGVMERSVLNRFLSRRAGTALGRNDKEDGGQKYLNIAGTMC